jgi:hypothetical protein
MEHFDFVFLCGGIFPFTTVTYWEVSAVNVRLFSKSECYTEQEATIL